MVYFAQECMALTYTPEPALGRPLPPFSLPGVDGMTYRESDFADAKILVVFFTCNHCPYAQATRPRLIKLAGTMRGQGVQFVAINANDETNYPEDSFEHMKEERYNYPFPYLRDESQEVARAFDAVCTPDIFVYDEKRTLAYRGRFDDNWKDETKVTRRDLANALEQLLRGEGAPTEQFPSMGCSIKWKHRL